MAKGGARPRTGPPQDPNSGRTDRARRAAKKAATAGESQNSELPITSAEFDPMRLPARGRTGNPPAYPLPKIVRFVMDGSGEGKPVKVSSDSLGEAFRKRELEIWRAVWKTPQAVAWERDPWRWPTIGEYCRLKAIVEAEPESNASLVARLREYRIEIGLTPDGLRMNGWAVAPDELAAQRARKATNSGSTTPAKKAAPTRRLR